MTGLDFLLSVLSGAAITVAWWQRDRRLAAKTRHERETDELNRAHAEAQHATLLPARCLRECKSTGLRSG